MASTGLSGPVEADLAGEDLYRQVFGPEHAAATA
jgi:hypothetical protein